MNNVRIGANGQLEGFPHHDMEISRIGIGKNTIQFRLSAKGTSDTRTDVCFGNVWRLVMNNLREGNIVDRFYLYALEDVSELTSNRLKNFFTSEEIEAKPSTTLVLSLECSYGAEFYALIDFEEGIDAYLRQVSRGCAFYTGDD